MLIDSGSKTNATRKRVAPNSIVALLDGCLNSMKKLPYYPMFTNWNAGTRDISGIKFPVDLTRRAASAEGMVRHTLCIRRRRAPYSQRPRLWRRHVDTHKVAIDFSINFERMLKDLHGALNDSNETEEIRAIVERQCCTLCKHVACPILAQIVEMVEGDELRVRLCFSGGGTYRVPTYLAAPLFSREAALAFLHKNGGCVPTTTTLDLGDPLAHVLKSWKVHNHNRFLAVYNKHPKQFRKIASILKQSPREVVAYYYIMKNRRVPQILSGVVVGNECTSCRKPFNEDEARLRCRSTSCKGVVLCSDCYSESMFGAYAEAVSNPFWICPRCAFSIEAMLRDDPPQNAVIDETTELPQLSYINASTGIQAAPPVAIKGSAGEGALGTASDEKDNGNGPMDRASQFLQEVWKDCILTNDASVYFRLLYILERYNKGSINARELKCAVNLLRQNVTLLQQFRAFVPDEHMNFFSSITERRASK